MRINMSINQEIISVIIPTFGRIDRLKSAIKSVCDQTYRNLEIIIVDDNIDNKIKSEVKKIVNAFADKRIVVLSNKINMGAALSRNEGIKAAAGKYISFLDDDDEYFPEKIEKQYELFKNSKYKNLAMVYCYCEEYDVNLVKLKEYRYDYTGQCLFEGMQDCIAATSQWMCRKEYLEEVGGFENIPCKQDSAVIVKLLSAGYTIDRVPEILSKYYNHKDKRISYGSHESRIEGEEVLWKICKENYYCLDQKQIKEVNYSFACRLLEHYLATKNYHQALQMLYFILFFRPFSKKTIRVFYRLIYN